MYFKMIFVNSFIWFFSLKQFPPALTSSDTQNNIDICVVLSVFKTHTRNGQHTTSLRPNCEHMRKSTRADLHSPSTANFPPQVACRAPINPTVQRRKAKIGPKLYQSFEQMSKLSPDGKLHFSQHPLLHSSTGSFQLILFSSFNFRSKTMGLRGPMTNLLNPFPKKRS